jgi:hypothetical protein
MVRTQGPLIALCVILGAGMAAHAQTGQISGEVLDPSGAAVSAAGVRLINQETMVERHTKTNDSGLYVFPFVPPGAYQAVVEAAGFSTLISEKLTLTVDQALVFNVQLKIGQAEQKVTVSAQSQVIDTTDAQVSTVVDQQQMEMLPNILRDPYQFILLTGGVNATNNGDGGFSVNGGRETSNNFLLDGADNNDVEFAGPVSGVNPDSAQEFRVITNNFMPEYGRSDGAIIDVVTKSGTNQWHGNVYEFGRWAALGARDFFDGAGTPKNPYTRNDFGASLGGPIVKDKTFFFFNYDGYRWATTRTIPFVVPTQAFLSGKFTFTGQDPTTGNTVSVPVDVSTPNSPNNVLHFSLDPAIQKIFSFYPKPTVSLGNGIQGVAFSAEPDNVTGNNYTLKVDHNFSSAENLSVGYVLGTGSDSNIGYLEALPGLGGESDTARTQTLSLQLTSTFSAKWLNKLVVSVIRYKSPSICTGLNTLNSVGVKDLFGDTTDVLMPAGLASWGCIDFGDSDGQNRGSGTYGVSDQVTRIAGRHTIKFGAGFSDLYSNNSVGVFSRPSVSFENFASYQIPALLTGAAAADSNEALQDMTWALFGQVTSQQQSQFFNREGSRLHTDELNMRARDFSFFGQDSAKVLPNLTLNYGLRWEFNGVPYETGNRLSTVPAAALSGPAPITFQTIGENGVYLYRRNWLVPQPRAGFAWDPFKTGKTSVRGAFGIFRDRTFFEVADITRGNPPFTETASVPIFNPATLSGTAYSSLAPPATLAPSPIVPNLSFFLPFVVDQNLRLPYSENWNFGIQRELRRDIQIEVNYIGVNFKRMLRVVDGNQPIPALVAQLRAFCEQPNPFVCVNTPDNSTVQSTNLYDGAELDLLPFDAVKNNALFHPELLKDVGSSSYNALVATVTKRFSHGIYIQGAYTWSHEIDDASFPLSPQINNSTLPSNSFNLAADRSNGSFDVRQALVVNYIWELPFGNQRAYFNHGVAGKALEGWSISGITRFQGGFPYDILTTRDSDGTGGDPNRPDYNPHATPAPVLNPTTQTGPNVGLFSEPPFGRPGDLGRNVFRGPGVNNWDMVFAKNSKLNDRFHLEFRGEMYNVFNRVQFSPPLINVIEEPLFGQSLSEFGRSDGTSGARQIQLALKLKF